MANARNKHIDNTHLSIDQAEERGFIHRDYIAHCLRWSHVAKFMHEKNRYKTAHVLDVGCGKDQPLARLLYTSKMNPDTGTYTGVDYNKLDPHPMFHTGKFPLTLIGNATFPNMALPRENYDVVVSFEVLEHVEPAHAFAMLKGMHDCLAPDGTIFISTPCYDAKVGAAGNHVNEMTFDALAWLIAHAGLAIDEVYGTFASQKDYKHLLTPGQREMFDQLSAYYDSNYVATIFAPLFPANSRNCLWKLRHHKVSEPERVFITPSDITDQRHSSSDQWPDFARSLA